MRRWWVRVPFRNVGDNWRYQRIPKLARDALGQRGGAHVVLADSNIRSALFGAADRNDDRGLTSMHRVANLRPGQALQ